MNSEKPDATLRPSKFQYTLRTMFLIVVLVSIALAFGPPNIVVGHGKHGDAAYEPNLLFWMIVIAEVGGCGLFWLWKATRTPPRPPALPP